MKQSEVDTFVGHSNTMPSLSRCAQSIGAMWQYIKSYERGTAVLIKTLATGLSEAHDKIQSLEDELGHLRRRVHENSWSSTVIGPRCREPEPIELSEEIKQAVADVLKELDYEEEVPKT